MKPTKYLPKEELEWRILHGLACEWEEAIASLERAIELGDIPSVDEAMCHIMLGWSYYTLDYHEKGPEEKCTNAAPHFDAALDMLLKLPQRELDLENLALEGIDACK